MSPETVGKGSRSRRLLALGAVCAGAILLPIVALFVLSWDFRQSAVAVLEGHSLLRLAQAERLVLSRTPRLVADYYAAAGDRPLILLVHGSNRRGRRSAPVRVLAGRFRDAGFPVLAIDLTGFGESEDPPFPLAEPLRFEHDVVAAAEFARARGLAPDGLVAYVGHSFGAGVVLRAGRVEPRPAAVVALGAPLTADRFRDRRPALATFAAERLRDMELPADGASIDVVAQYLLEMDPLAQLENPDNPPVLLVKGESETRHGAAFLREHLPRNQEPVGLFEVARAPHSYEMTGLWGLGLALHDPEITDQLTLAVTDWIADWARAGRVTRPASLTAITLATTPWPDLGDVGRTTKWSTLELTLAGPPAIGTSDSANPFALELEARFESPTGSVTVVPGFYDGDGRGGPDGCVWRVRFTPDRTGRWTFETSSGHPLLDGYRGHFFVDPTAEHAPVFERRGRLSYVGRHYLKFVDGPFWIKGGADEPEDLLAPGVLGDWAAKKRAIDYLASRGVNSIYLLLHNVGGDGGNVWPWISDTDSNHFNLAKLAEWESFFEHVQRSGLVLHLVLEDDSAWTGFNRRLYYREMVARFGHFNALYWNIVEEYAESYTAREVKGFAELLRRLDPYDHPITVHNLGEEGDWDAFLGDPNFDVTSFQTPRGARNAETVQWRERSAAIGRPLVVSFDEAGLFSETDRAAARHLVWSVYLAGGNVELFSRGVRSKGYAAFEGMWEDLGRARSFMESLPFWEMEPSNDLLAGGLGELYCFAKPGEVYVIYLERGGAFELDLTDAVGDLTLTWLDPKSGARASGGSLSGGAVRAIGPAPFAGDSVVVVAGS